MNGWKTYEEEDLPTGAGIYCFRLKLVTLDSVGLIGNSNYSPTEIENAKSKLINRLSFVTNVYGNREMIGGLHEKNKRENTPLRFDVTAIQTRLLNVESAKAMVDRSYDIPRLIRLFSTANEIMPPLYVGMAYDQTLSQRYKQHKSNHQNYKKGGFGERAHAAGIRWSDLMFAAIEFGIATDMESISLYEDMLHGLYKPVFSHK